MKETKMSITNSTVLSFSNNRKNIRQAVIFMDIWIKDNIAMVQYEV
jgi:hypothetical protein